MNSVVQAIKSLIVSDGMLMVNVLLMVVIIPLHKKFPVLMKLMDPANVPWPVI